ncbi:zinc finger protein [Sesbania bispinosa]|nr:zinc finger protein [Sesbania bispinosa]
MTNSNHREPPPRRGSAVSPCPIPIITAISLHTILLPHSNLSKSAKKEAKSR